MKKLVIFVVAIFVLIGNGFCVPTRPFTKIAESVAARGAKSTGFKPYRLSRGSIAGMTNEALEIVKDSVNREKWRRTENKFVKFDSLNQRIVYVPLEKPLEQPVPQLFDAWLNQNLSQKNPYVDLSKEHQDVVDTAALHAIVDSIYKLESKPVVMAKAPEKKKDERREKVVFPEPMPNQSGLPMEFLVGGIILLAIIVFVVLKRK